MVEFFKRVLSIVLPIPRLPVTESLHSFFENDKVLRDVLVALFGKPDTIIRLLVLDPACEQAKYRSYRESLLQPKQNRVTFNDYCKDPKAPHESDLYRHTEATMTSF